MMFGLSFPTFPRFAGYGNGPRLELMATIPDLPGLDQGLPANIDAEKTILGAILMDNAAHSEAAERLESDDFSLDSHRRIFLRMTELMNEQRAVDIVTLSNELARYKEIEAVGGVAYLASLTEGLPFRPVIEEYIRIVKDKIADYVDPPRVVPLIGPVQLHHCHYKCTIYYSETTRVGWPIPHTLVDEDCQEVIYIDHNHFHMVGNINPGPSSNY